jgi:hypothetical protein
LYIPFRINYLYFYFICLKTGQNAGKHQLNQKKRMKANLTVILLASLAFSCSQVNKTASDSRITVASYYFPDYHIRRGDHLPISKQSVLDNKSEWELVRSARPRFEGHQQPKTPLWGETDEKDPAVMAMKIDAAADNGVDVFIFDWYIYQGKPFLNQCLDDGFLKAPNTEKLKFALMWANHDWKDLFPANEVNLNDLDVMHPGKVNREEFEKIGDDIIREYFTKPNYWLIDGKPYFSIYDLQNFIAGFGSIEATKAAMDHLREKAVVAGLKGVHFNVVAWGNITLPGETKPISVTELIKMLDFDSATSYTWIHHVPMKDTVNDYNLARDKYFAHWDKVKKEYPVPYFPNISMGWDSSPRTNQSMGWNPGWGYPYGGVLINNTPENFKKALEMTKEKLLADPNGPRIFNINCWNEWTEGSYLEPDTLNKMAYLDAVREVFRGNEK